MICSKEHIPKRNIIFSIRVPSQQVLNAALRQVREPHESSLFDVPYLRRKYISGKFEYRFESL